MEWISYVRGGSPIIRTIGLSWVETVLRAVVSFLPYMCVPREQQGNSPITVVTDD